MRRPMRRFPSSPDDGALRQFHALLSEAKKPFLIVGGGGWSEQARRDLEAFASAHEVPVGVSFRCQDYFDNLHPAMACMSASASTQKSPIGSATAIW
jgi:acetolactate synthase-1/2/3 large subunit